MPYCARCSGEYQNWVQVCPDCGVPLVEKLPEPPSKPKQKTKKHGDPLVIVATAPNEPLAMMWAGILEDKGIHSLVRGRDLRAAMYTPSLLSHSDVLVLASQVEKAKQILVPFIEDS